MLRSPRATLALLLFVYALNFVDRQVLGILAPAIKADLHLTDTQLGLLGGIAFALLYTTLGLPAGWLADRTGRARVIAGALALWSGFTALCGIAGGFWSLFLCRLGVGVGEAGGVAPSYALIADLAPPHRRGRALAVYALGVPIGSAAGTLLGGWIAARVDWRAAFLVLGLFGLAAAPFVARGLREPPRTATTPAAIGPTLARLAAKPAFWLLSLGAASCSLIGYGLMFWLPSLLGRSFGLPLEQVSTFFGAVLLVGGASGIMLGGWLGDRLARRGVGAYAAVPAACVLLAIPCYAAAFTGPPLPLLFVLLAVPQALGLTWYAPVTAAVQGLVQPHERATASAAFLFVNNLVGLGLGTLVLGALSDALTARYGAEALKVSAYAGLSFYALAALLLFAAAFRLRRDLI